MTHHFTPPSPATDRRANAPVDFPTEDWIEAARKAFLRRYYEENGDLIDDCNNVYGD